MFQQKRPPGLENQPRMCDVLGGLYTDVKAIWGVDEGQWKCSSPTDRYLPMSAGRGGLVMILSWYRGRFEVLIVSNSSRSSCSYKIDKEDLANEFTTSQFRRHVRVIVDGMFTPGMLIV